MSYICYDVCAEINENVTQADGMSCFHAKTECFEEQER